MSLYHVEVFMKPVHREPIFEGRLRYSRHAQDEAASDKYGHIVLPQFFSAANAKLIEAEFDEQANQVVKQVWRQPLDKDRDLVLVMGRDGFVRTVWVNLHSDKHRSLNTARYARR